MTTRLTIEGIELLTDAKRDEERPFYRKDGQLYFRCDEIEIKNDDSEGILINLNWHGKSLAFLKSGYSYCITVDGKRSYDSLRLTGVEVTMKLDII